MNAAPAVRRADVLNEREIPDLSDVLVALVAWRLERDVSGMMVGHMLAQAAEVTALSRLYRELPQPSAWVEDPPVASGPVAASAAGASTP